MSAFFSKSKPKLPLRGRRLLLDPIRPRILPGRLVEMAVDDDMAIRHRNHPYGISTLDSGAALGITTKPDSGSTGNRFRSFSGSKPISVPDGI